MVAHRAVALVCVAVALLTGWVPAVACGRHVSSDTPHSILHDGPSAPASPMVFDQIDRVVPPTQKYDPTSGHVSWSVAQSRPMRFGATSVLSRSCIMHDPDTLQKLHCLLSV
ncbi:MAG: hypothetical protein R3C45_20590 [Phycisphaerales bacterium]